MFQYSYKLNKSFNLTVYIKSEMFSYTCSYWDCCKNINEMVDLITKVF